jgi:hypothetical protein
VDVVNKLKHVLLLEVHNFKFAVRKLICIHHLECPDAVLYLIQRKRTLRYEEVVNDAFDSSPFKHFEFEGSVGVVATHFFNLYFGMIPLCSLYVVVFLSL